uniref:Uncharacterized protein n=1 Tax=Manihot esculenta TaxID=3983 RepID=A0A2C9VBX4_MANES
MPSSKVYLTYKRKLPLYRTGTAHQNGCHDSLSEGPSDTSVTVPDKHDAPSDEHISENQQRKSLIFPGCVVCGVTGNLLQCNDCHQPYHQECSDRLLMDTSGKDAQAPSYLDISLTSNLNHVQFNSYSIMNIDSEEKLISQSTGINTRKSLDFISSNSSLESICIAVCDTRSCFLKGSNLKKDKIEADIKSSFLDEKICSFHTTQSKTTDGAVSVKVSLEDNSRYLEIHGMDIKAVDSAQAHANFALKEKISHGSESKSKDISPISRQWQIFKANMHTAEAFLGNLQISLNDAANDPWEARGIDMELVNTKCQAESEILSSDGAKATVVADYTKEGKRPYLDLSVTPDSCGTLDHDVIVNLDLGCQKEPLHGASESLRGSMDSTCTSRSHATVCDRVSPAELLQGKNKREGEVSPVHSTRAVSDASTSVEEAGDNSKDNDLDCHQFSMDNTSKDECLQASSRSGSLLDLGLSLSQPTGSDMANSYSEKCPTTSSMWNSHRKIIDFVQDVLPQSSSNHAASLLRHKLMLDSIVIRASSLNAKDALQDKFKSYTIWSEERTRLSLDWDLSEQWEEEEAKLLSGSRIVQFNSPITHGISLDNNDHYVCKKYGIWRENATEETTLSLGDIYARRTSNSSKRQRVNFTSVERNDIHRPATYPRSASYSNFHGEIYSRGSCDNFGCMTLPSCDHIANHVQALPFSGMRNLMDGGFGGIRANELQTSGSAHHSNVALGMRHGKSDMCSSLGLVSKPDNLIIIDSDASSEETISDDRSARP